MATETITQLPSGNPAQSGDIVYAVRGSTDYQITAGSIAALAGSGSGYVPTTTTVNGHALSANVVVSASDLTTGTLPHAQLPTLVSGDIPNNAANTSGTAAGLSANITESQVTGLTTALAALAPLASPSLTGAPTAPTATVGTNTTQLATTAFVAAAVGASSSGLSDPGSNGVIKRTSLGITAIAVAADINTSLGYTAANDSLVAHLAGTETIAGAKTFSTSPFLPTPSALDDSTKGATTAYADSAVGVEKTRALAAEALLAPLASPALTGTPTAPTKTALTNSTALATTAYADAAVGVETTRAEAAEVLLLPKSGGTLTGLLTVPTSDLLIKGATYGTTIATAATANWTLTLPTTAGTNLYVLQTDGSGNTSWVAQSGGSGMTWPAAAGIAVYAGSSAWGTSLAAPASAIVGVSDTQTLTNKTVDGVTPTTFGYLDATSSIQTQFGTKAPLASPTFTGTVTIATAAITTLTGTPSLPTGATAVTQTSTDNSTKLATTAFVTTAVAASGLLVPTAYSANATVATTVVYGQATAGSGGITLTLQSGSLVTGQKQRFMKMDSAAGVVSFVDSGSKTFNGSSGWAQTSWSLVNQGQYAEFVWDGTQFTVFGN